MRAPFFVTAAAGTADLLAAELAALGIDNAREVQGGVACEGELVAAYRACLESRLALRVLWQLVRFPATDANALYAGVREIDWASQLAADGTLAVDFSGSLAGVTHTQFGAQRVKDAIVDQFRERTGTRPSVDRDSPWLRINAHAARGAMTIAIDLSGESLHRRGYRGGQGAAPLKENLAAAILVRAGWPAIAAAGGSFVDPMCGSGTLPIEAALIAADIAPGLSRAHFGFERWGQHDPDAWAALRAAAELRRQPALLTPGRIRGFDRDPVAIRDAEANAARAGLDKRLFFQRCELEKLPAAPAPTGLFAVNPPYGERIGETDDLRALYALLGERLRADYRGWDAALFTGNPALGRELGINARRTHRMMNGPIECRLLRLAIEPSEFVRAREPGRPPPIDAEAARARPGAQMFANRLRKNLDKLASWAKREQVSCFRVYDADMPEYAFAIDLYQSDPAGTAGRWLYVQEYAPPATVDRAKAKARREEAISVLPEVTGLPTDAIYWRTRRPQKGKSQYEAIAEVDERVIVEEGGLKFLVNFTDYLDTGLFLDHRKTRARLRELAKGRSLPQPLLLHRRRDRVRGCGRGEGHDQRRHVAHLPRVGEAQHGRQRARRRARVRPGRLHRLARRAASGALRPHLPRPADLLELQAHGPRVRRAAGPCGPDPRNAQAARAGRLAAVLDQLPQIQAGRGSAHGAGHQGHFTRHDPARLRAGRADPSLLRDPGRVSGSARHARDPAGFSLANSAGTYEFARETPPPRAWRAEPPPPLALEAVDAVRGSAMRVSSRPGWRSRRGPRRP